MSHSSLVRKKYKPAKPREDCPLFPHATGRWAKKVRGKFHYFGKVADDPKGEVALLKWLDDEELLAGRTPRGNRDGLTLKDLCNRFLTAKEAQRDAGDITARSYADYFATCKRLLMTLGSDRLSMISRLRISRVFGNKVPGAGSRWKVLSNRCVAFRVHQLFPIY